jgi:sporulation protein YlmC with PRC-barrel domain
MKKSKRVTSTLVAAALCVVSTGWTAALAQNNSSETDQPLIQQTSESATAPVQAQLKSRCSQLIGTRVVNEQGDKLGRIADVVISFDNDHVSYCVLRVKPGMFARHRLVEVPLAAFQPSPDGSRLILNADRANLANATGFDPNQWPSAVSTVWGAEPPPPTQLPSTEVYAPAPSQAPVGAGHRTVYDNSWNWDQLPIPQTASQAIDQMHFETQYGLPLSSH